HITYILPLSLHDALPILSRGRLSSRVDIPDLLCAGRALLLAVGEYSTLGDTEFMECLGIRFAPPAISLLWCVRVLERSGSLYPLDRKSTRLNSSHEWISY